MKNNMRLKVVCFYLTVFCFSACAHNLEGDSFWANPKDISRQIKKKGARAILNEGYKNDVTWGRILAGIETGTPEWLGVASELYSISDAGSLEQLSFAVGNAIDAHPAEVLRLLKQGDAPALLARQKYLNLNVCQGVDIDDVRYDSAELSLAEIEKRKAALAKVTDPQLTELRDACVQALEGSKHGILRFYGKTGDANSQE